VNNDLTALGYVFNPTTSIGYGCACNKVHEVIKQSVSDSTLILHPSAQSTTTYSGINNLNQYGSVGSSSLSYDGNGNLTQFGSNSFSFNTENQLTGFSNGSTTLAFEYDALSRQAVKAQTGGSSTRFLYSGFRNIADYDKTSGNLLTRHIFGAALDEPVADVDGTSGNVTYLHQDRNHSVVARTDSSGNVLSKDNFSAFGESSSLTTNRFGYTAQRFDSESGQYYYRARYYEPAIGRFIQPDPIGYSVGLNLYGYVGNNPISFVDPLGLDPNTFMYATRDAAAAAAFSENGSLVSQTRANGQEIGTWIYQAPGPTSTQTNWAYSTPFVSQGKYVSQSQFQANQPTIMNPADAAQAHSHPDQRPWWSDAIGYENFSKDDIDLLNSLKMTGYLYNAYDILKIYRPGIDPRTGTKVPCPPKRMP
jgi:RHS repeat-associated protein